MRASLQRSIAKEPQEAPGTPPLFLSFSLLTLSFLLYIFLDLSSPKSNHFDLKFPNFDRRLDLDEDFSRGMLKGVDHEQLPRQLVPFFD